jgi:hypothetical protein
MKKRYLIEVIGGISPIARGPYKTEERRSGQAKKLHRKQDEDDAVFWADINEKGKLKIGSYIGGFFADEWDD